MNPVAIHTFGRPLAACCQQLAVNTRLVLGELIHGQLRLVFAHETGVAVAASAKFGHALAGDSQLEAAACIHRDVLVGFMRVTAVAMEATDRIGEMNVIGELQARPLHDAVAIEAGILAETGSAGQKGKQCNQVSPLVHKIQSPVRMTIKRKSERQKSKLACGRLTIPTRNRP